MTAYTRHTHSGTGPGRFTPDGCSVETYLRLPERGEAGIVAGALPVGAVSLLELGAGAGRMTRPLLAHGFRLTAVDESAAMLERIHGARTLCGTIENLDLGERFDAVTLASCLVNSADPAQSRRLLRTCERHVRDGGCVIIQREADDRHENPQPQTLCSGGGMTVRLVSSEPVTEAVTRFCVGYESENSRWTQTFYSRRLRTPEFEEALAGAGLQVDRYLTDDRTWVRAVPVAPRTATGK